MDIDFENLIYLQKLDEDIKNTSLFLDKIPYQISEIEKKIEESSKIVSQEKERLISNQKKRKDLENNVQDIKEKISKYKHQLNEVKTNKEYRSLLKEIDDATHEVDALEDEIISEMLAADNIENDIKAAVQTADEVREKYTKEKEALNANKKEMEKTREQLIQEKEKIVLKIPSDQMDLYLKIFKNKKGIALSPVNDEFCSMCHMRIRPQVLNELKEKKKIILCENCGRILYWLEKSA